MTEPSVIGLVHNPAVSFTSRFFQAGGSAQGLKLPCFIQRKYFSANWMDKLKPTQCIRVTGGNHIPLPAAWYQTKTAGSG
jgi:hypothetical protein